MSSHAVCVLTVIYFRHQQAFCVKGWVVNILGIVGHMVSVTGTQLCQPQTTGKFNGHDLVPAKLHVQKQGRTDLACTVCLPILDLFARNK